ncbi:MAG TPA: IS200/IS605 family transposase [Bacteroidia bacterium]|jgi:REP element-mobilizing transposase RayT|nr:IS200/IS605 family transposase [Bacteroidia bacterium]
MADTFSQIYIHIVFAVKHRERSIQSEWKEELFKYIQGVVKGQRMKIYAINGMSDHIHILISMRPDISISKITAEIKANSSKWINERKLGKGVFRWQAGYGAFSCAKSAVPSVARYIENQETHHKEKTYSKEFVKLLKENNVEYEEKYLFD